MRNVILAPHVDDEMIGCWSLFANGQVSYVVYFEDLTAERKEEAKHMQQIMGVKHISFEGFDFIVEPDMMLYVPNIADAHPSHKMVNHWAKKHNNPKKYYSVDMNVPFVVLDDIDQKDKRGMLTLCYPSQSKLFENDKYWLFESIMDDDSDKMIWVKFQKEGVHCYPAALTDPKLADVSFLGSPHRHIFHFKVAIQVWHNDRDIEFIQFKRWLESLYNGETLELNHKSCEMIADELYSQILLRYPDRRVRIEVSEDNENGVEVNYG